MSYEDLARRSLSLAERLRQLDAGSVGDRVLLLFPNGIDFVVALFGCFAAGVVSVPAPPPLPGREHRLLRRLEAIVADAGPAMVLTDPPTAALVDSLEPDASPLTALPRLVVGGGDDAAAGDLGVLGPPAPSPEGGVVCLQYTSGSTSRPKGVQVSVSGLLANLEQIRNAWGYADDSLAVMWVPNFHDDGLVHGILEPVYSGYPCWLLSPMTVVSRPIEWLRAITTAGATHAGGPDFIYALAAARTSPEDRRELDLSTWRVAYDAAEPVRATTLALFEKTFAPHGFRRRSFRPSYGLAEATLLVTTPPVDEEPAVLTVDPEVLEREGRAVPAAESGAGRPLVSCGRAVGGTRLAIVEPASGVELGDGEVGEVWVASPSLAAGYRGRPRQSAATFAAHLAGSGDGPFLRTGDLGFVRDGNLYVVGRSKDLIILNGRNVFPQDVEASVEATAAEVRAGCVAAFALDEAGQERLGVVAEVRPGAAAGPLADRIRQAVADEHELPVWILALAPPGSVPKTSSGKIQRGECRRLLAEGTLPILHLWKAAGGAVPVVTTASPSVVEPTAGDGERVVEQLLGWLEPFVSERLDLHLMDERRSVPPHVVLELGNRGLFGLQAPARWGGLGLGHRDTARVLAALAAQSLTLAAMVSVHNTLALRTLLDHVRPGRREQLIAELATGRRLGAFALTEPAAGANPWAMTSRAEPAGAGHWRLHGEKSWSGSAAWAGAIVVVVRLGGDAGHAAFVVEPPVPGLRLGAELPTLGLRALPQSRLHLDGVLVDKEALLGEAGAGLEVAQRSLASARFALAALGLGALRRAAVNLLDYAMVRRIGTGTLLDHPLTRRRLADVQWSVAAVEALVHHVGAALDAGAGVADEVLAAAKVASSELAWSAADGLVQTLGARGYSEANDASRLLRDVRALRIVEGPSEVLLQFVGSRLRHRPTALRRFLRESLGCLTVADRLDEAVELSSRGASADAAGLVSHRLGEIAAAALLWAAAERGGEDGRVDADCAAWARRRFDRLCYGVGDEGAPAAGELIAAGRRLRRLIGAGHGLASGEEWRRDPLLASSNGVAASSVRPDAEANARQGVAAPRGTKGHGEVAEWIRRWVARQQGVASETVEVDRPFHFLGLDSVAVTLLVEELGDWLGRELSPTLAWTHPTIGALGDHLAETAESPAPSPRP